MAPNASDTDTDVNVTDTFCNISQVRLRPVQQLLQLDDDLPGGQRHSYALRQSLAQSQRVLLCAKIKMGAQV